MKTRIVLTSVLFSCIFAISTSAATLYRDDNGLRCHNDDGTDISGCWYQQSETEPWYYFDKDGYAHTGFLRTGGKTYYLRPSDGTMMANRTVTLDGSVWKFNGDGVGTNLSPSYSGWMIDDITWYYRYPDGSFATDGWRKIDGEWYYFDQDGYMMTGLISVGDSMYYLYDNGVMAHDTQLTIGGVTYTFDSSGAAAWPYKKITEVAPEQAEMWNTVSAMADSILAGIVNNNMTDRQKAEAIYDWVRGNFRYSGHAATRDWVLEAYNGFRRRHGDCFTYYSASTALLMRCGIPSIEVVRYTDNGHYWNLVQLSDGNWYHFDTTPRRAGGYFCLWTDAKILDYSAKHGHDLDFDTSLYPRTPQ